MVLNSVKYTTNSEINNMSMLEFAYIRVINVAEPARERG